jgi:hypothetical protein
MLVVVLVSLAFALSRFAAPGHPVSPWGTWEAMAHVWMGVLLASNLLTWVLYKEARSRGLIAKDHLRDVWIFFACWFVPSMIELALFLVGPFNPF